MCVYFLLSTSSNKNYILNNVGLNLASFENTFLCQNGTITRKYSIKIREATVTYPHAGIGASCRKRKLSLIFCTNNHPFSAK